MIEIKRRGRPRLDPTLRRREILEKAIELFARNGYTGTDIQAVARSLGIAKGTVYLYFSSKRELFLAAVEYAIKRLAERIDQEVRQVTGPVEKVKALVSAHFRFFDEDEPLAEVIVREGGEFRAHAESTYYSIYAQNAGRLEGIVGDGVRSGVFRRINPRETSEILANLLTGTIYTHLYGHKTGKVADTMEATTEFLLHGIAYQEGNPARTSNKRRRK
jgi:AcrR family transcriptional regulator